LLVEGAKKGGKSCYELLLDGGSWTVVCISLWKASNSFRSSVRTTSVSAVSPCRKAFWQVLSLPCRVRGPVLIAAFRRLAAIYRFDAIGRAHFGCGSSGALSTGRDCDRCRVSSHRPLAISRGSTSGSTVFHHSVSLPD
jgi:hypothetical protein